MLNKPQLEQALKSLYEETSVQKSAAEFAHKTAQAVFDFAITGIPMTQIVTMPGAVALAMTVGPVLGTGVGGIDKPSPGMGLEPAKKLLEANLIQIYTHGNKNRSPAEIARQMSDAIYHYFSQAIVMTHDTSGSVLPAPPPLGPVTGGLTGTGGVLSSLPGKGYSAAKPLLENALRGIYSSVGNSKNVAQAAREVSDALHSFFQEGVVQTTGTFTAIATVDVITSSGAYSAGVGSSVQGVLS